MSHIKVLLLKNDSDKAEQLIKSHLCTKPDDIEFLRLTELSRKDFLKRWFFSRSSICALYTDNLKYQKRRRLWILLLCASNSSEKLVLEGSNKVEKILTTRTLLTSAFTLALELFLCLVLWFSLIVFLYAYSAYLRLTPKGKVVLGDDDKIVFLRTNFWFGLQYGGSVSHIKGFTEAAQSLGYSIVFISSDTLADINAPINICRPRSFFTFSPALFKLVYNYTFFRYGLKIIREMKPKFLYHRHDALTFSNVMLSRCLRVPLILEFNSSEVWRKKHWGGSKLLWFHRKCEEIALYGASRIVTVSETNKQNLWEWYKISEAKVTVNPNGVDPDFFRPNREARKKIRFKLRIQENLVVGFVGSFGVWHGVDILSSVMIDVIKVNPQIHFLWVGDGPYMKYVKENVKKYNLQESVTITGAVPHEDIPGYLNACDILVSPHTPQVDGGEFFGSPTKLFEYMAVGKGIIASNLGQIGQVLENMKDSILVKSGDKEELTNAILRLAENPSLREFLGTNARSKVVRLYTWQINANRVLEILNSNE